MLHASKGAFKELSRLVPHHGSIDGKCTGQRREWLEPVLVALLQAGWCYGAALLRKKSWARHSLAVVSIPPREICAVPLQSQAKNWTGAAFSRTVLVPSPSFCRHSREEEDLSEVTCINFLDISTMTHKDPVISESIRDN